jgi:hypothetical protein
MLFFASAITVNFSCEHIKLLFLAASRFWCAAFRLFRFQKGIWCKAAKARLRCQMKPLIFCDKQFGQIPSLCARRILSIHQLGGQETDRPASFAPLSIKSMISTTFRVEPV